MNGVKLGACGSEGKAKIANPLPPTLTKKVPSARVGRPIQNPEKGLPTTNARHQSAIKTNASTSTSQVLKDVIPAHCFVRDDITSLSLVVRDGAIIFAIGYLGNLLPVTNLSLVHYLLWNVYWFAMGTALTGW